MSQEKDNHREKFIEASDRFLASISKSVRPLGEIEDKLREDVENNQISPAES